MLNTSSKNILWINYTRSICIIFVFFVHSEIYSNYLLGNLNSFVHPFYVNTFFFISGYLFFRKQLSPELINKDITEYYRTDGKKLISNLLYRIVIPSIIFSAFEYLPSVLLRGKALVLSGFIYKTLGGGTYWFTSALVVAEFFLFLLFLTRKKNILFYLLCSFWLFVCGYLLTSYKFKFINEYPAFPWHYKQGLFAIVFLAFGGLYYKMESVLNTFLNKKFIIPLSILYIFLLTIYPSQFKVIISTLSLNINGICISLLASIILIEICKLIPRLTILNYIGQNTIGFYFMSGALPILLNIIFSKIFIAPSLTRFSLVFVGSIFLSYVLVYFINKKMPFLFDLRLMGSNNK